MKARTVLGFTVGGIPVPQGSKRAFVVKGRAVLADVNSKALKAWRKDVAAAAAGAYAGRATLDEPVAVRVRFVFERPKTVKREHMAVAPDVDKLARAVLDSLTSAAVYRDDSRVVHLDVTKSYGWPAGAVVEVGVIEGEVNDHHN